MFIPDEIVAVLARRYRASTIATVDTYMRRFHKIVGGDSGGRFDIGLLADVDVVKSVLDRIVNPATRKTMCFYILQVARAGGVGTDGIEKLAEKAVAGCDRKYAEPSGKEVANTMRWADIVAVRDGIVVSDAGSAIDALIMTLYTSIPPLRGEDYVNTRIADRETPEGNYVDLSKARLVLRNYKTSDKHGERRIRLPADVMAAVDRVRDLVRSVWLLPRADGGHMTCAELRACLYRLTGKKISTSMLRKIYVSTFVPEMSAADRKILARIMGHTLEQQEFTYRRLAATLDGDVSD
jgi:hypothetical protein